MTRILFTVTTDLTYDQRMDRICTVLAKEGYEVTLVGREKKDSVPLADKPYRQKRMKCFFEKGKFFYLEFNLRLLSKLLFSRFDILCAIDLDTILPGYFVSSLKRKKFVYDAHEYFTEVIELVHRPRIQKIWKAIEGYVVPKVVYAYTVSDGLKKIFEQQYATKFEVIRNVPFLELASEGDGKMRKEKHLIYIGAVNEGRGLEELIDAMPDIQSTLFIYGKGDKYLNLVEEVERRGLSDKVKFLGYVKPDELKKVTREAYIGVLLLRNDSLSYYYSLANKFFDYMHAEIPQVVIDFPEYRSINERYKVAELAELKKDSIVKAVNKLLTDEPYYLELKENCRKAKKIFNWQEESKKLIAFYDHVKRS